MDLAVQTTAAIKRSREEDDIDNEEIMNDSKKIRQTKITILYKMNTMKKKKRSYQI